jgi:hypothetical protein
VSETTDSSELRTSEAAGANGDRCELCGAYTDQRVGERTICLDCYEERASCCSEFGGTDLWRGHDDM